MTDLQRLKKAELIERCIRLQEEIEELQSQIDNLNSFYVELENEVAIKSRELENADRIKDMHWFTWNLKSENLLTPELAAFIENYMRYNNLICEWVIK